MEYFINDKQVRKKEFDERLLDTCEGNHFLFQHQLYDLEIHRVTLINPHKNIKFQIKDKGA